MMPLFHKAAQLCSRTTTEQYSSSFSSAIRLLHRDIRKPIYNIYGFVRFADEIVDTFRDFDRQLLLKQFRQETFDSIQRGISVNPILHSFQLTVNEYHIDPQLIDIFFHSMEMDLEQSFYKEKEYGEYIYGSAEVVGLMCLTVFCDGDKNTFTRLTPAAQSLGAAFQKVNFLRDMQSDFQNLRRSYFPGVDVLHFDKEAKSRIEKDIETDFHRAYEGILSLPWKARFGVYVAYKYYHSLFLRIKKLQPYRMMQRRVRVPNYHKAMILLRAGVKNRLKMI